MDNTGQNGQAQPLLLPDNVARLEQAYVEILGLLDGPTATHLIMLGVPELTGVDLAYLGEPTGSEAIVLQHPINTVTDRVSGLVVPIGTGLGGKVMATRRPMWVGDYCASADISHHFKAPAAAEGVKAMLAVPIVHQGALLGVLYGANRAVTSFGDRTADAMQRVAVKVAAAAVVAERARHAAEVAVHEERRRLALKLHDTVGAVLFTLRAGIRRLGDETELGLEIRRRLDAIEQQAAEASEALRGSVHVLSAPPEEVALGVALREHCRAFRERTGVPARLIILTDLPTLPRGSVTALADLTREALHNVEKHARAQSVVVSLFCQRDGVALKIADDGVGFDEESVGGDGLGLAAMAERMARVGGTVTTEPNEDGGVTIHAWLPR
jgi:LuxR family transcriptional regulator, regulator of acetate metabolism